MENESMIPTKQSWRISVFLLVISIILLAAGWILFRGNLQLPWDLDFKLEFPRGVLLTPEGNFIVFDKGDRRISMIDPRGQVLWSLPGGNRNQGFFTGTLMGMDALGRIWVDNNILDEEGVVEKDEIFSINQEGQISPPVFTRTYTPEERIDYGLQQYYVKEIRGAATYFRGDGEGNTGVFTAALDGTGEILQSLIPGVNVYEQTSSALALPGGQAWLLGPGGKIQYWDTRILMDFFDPKNSSTGIFQAPSDLIADARGNLIFLDNRRRIMGISPEGVLRQIFLPDPRLKDFYIPAINIPPSKNLALIDQGASQLWVLDLDKGSLEPGPWNLRFSDGNIFLNWTAWGFLLLGILSMMAAFVIFFDKILKRRTPLLVKQLLIFLPLVLTAVILVSTLVYNNLETRLSGEIETRLKAWGYLGSQFISAEDLEGLHPETDGIAAILSSEAFPRLVKGLTTGVAGNAQDWNAAVWDYVYFARGKDLYVFDQYGYFERYLPKEGMRETLDSGEARIQSYRDAYSSWYSSFTPLKNEAGETVGLYEVTIDKNILEDLRSSYRSDLMKSVTLVAFALILAFSAFTVLLLRSIGRLKAGAALVSVGNYDAEVRISTRDEIEDLGIAFNSMAREVKDSITTVINLNAANSKFVPSQFLLSLGRGSITDVVLGDQVEKHMTVFFSDIRNFTDLSEKLTPEENFRFLNRYLSRMGPRVRENKGFIDKYIGDSIMALFPEGPQDAVKTALGFFEGLEEFPELQIGIGIHYGRLMLGVIGEQERYDGTVISDSVNLASRIESLTKFYGVSILISGQALEGIPDKEFFQYRLLDKVRVKGKDLVTDLYEIIPPGSPGASLKVHLAGQYEEAHTLFSGGMILDAQRAFAILAKANPEDNPSRLFLGRCDSLLAQGIPMGWDGITRFNEK